MDITAYLSWCRSWGATEATVSTRHYILTAYEKATGGSGLSADLEAWVYRPGLSEWSRCTYHTTLKAYFAWEAHIGVREGNPMDRVRRPRRKKDAPRPFSHRQMQAILAARTTHPYVVDWMALGMFAGLRAHEVAKLRGEDVTAESIFVKGKGGRTAFVPTHERLQVLIDRYPEHGYWFPGRKGPTVRPHTVSCAATTLLRSLGIEGSFHRCRHTFGTMLLNTGASLRTVQELMRHESVTSTQIYTLVSDSDRNEAIRMLAA